MRYIFLLIGLGVSINAGDIKDLIWQDSDEVKTIQIDWEGAKEYCEDLVLGAKDDWRLPTIKELQSIVDITQYKPAIKKEFKNVKGGYYWSSTQDIERKDYAWSVDFCYGNSSRDLILNVYSVRCVRE